MPEKDQELFYLRNIGIIAHIDAGKTTTTERILYHGGKIHKIGEVHEGEAQMDFMKQEQERGITIQSAATEVEWALSRNSDTAKQIKYTINIIDTPGHVDFTAEVERSLRVLDGGVVVIDGKKGVEAQTETVFRQARKYQIPLFFFVNKMDGAENEGRFEECLISIKKKLRATPLAVQLPIGAGRELQGVIDLVEQKAYYFQMGDKEENYQVKEIPNSLVAKAQQWRRELIEKIIDQDETLALKYLEGQELTNVEVRRLLRQVTLTGNYFPVFCGSAYKHVGVKLILDGVIDYLPSPLDIADVPVYSTLEKGQSISTINCNSSLPYLALAFKVMVDDYNNKITFIRVYAGKITSNSYVYNASQDKEERIPSLVKMHANKETRIEEVRAGDIAAVKNLKYTVTGDTFSDKKNPLLLEPIEFTKPVISQAIVPQTKEDNENLSEALEKLKIQDPSFEFAIDQETRQIIIRGMGELHLEILVDRLKREFNLNLVTEPPKVSYRETITKKLENIEAWYKKKTGGRGHDARIWITFEPNKGKGFEFIDAKKGQDMSNKDAEEVKKGVEEAMSSGLLLNYPLLDIKVTLLGGKRHEVDTQPGDFKQAAILAFRGNGVEERNQRVKDLGAVLLEPIMDFEVVVPKDYMGDVLANLGSRRALIENSEEKEGESYIQGKAPLKEMLNYSTVLRQLTKGRGNYSMHLADYQEVPRDTLQEILEKEKVAK